MSRILWFTVAVGVLLTGCDTPREALNRKLLLEEQLDRCSQRELQLKSLQDVEKDRFSVFTEGPYTYRSDYVTGELCLLATPAQQRKEPDLTVTRCWAGIHPANITGLLK